MAQQRPERHLKKVLHYTYGIVFLGTPHHGSGLAHWAESLAKAIGVLKQTNTEILAVFKSDSEVLERVQHAFHTMFRSRGQDGFPPIEITCFFEELPLPGVGTVSLSSIIVFISKPNLLLGRSVPLCHPAWFCSNRNTQHSYGHDKI